MSGVAPCGIGRCGCGLEGEGDVVREERARRKR